METASSASLKSTSPLIFVTEHKALKDPKDPQVLMDKTVLTEPKDPQVLMDKTVPPGHKGLKGPRVPTEKTVLTA